MRAHDILVFFTRHFDTCWNYFSVGGFGRGAGADRDGDREVVAGGEVQPCAERIALIGEDNDFSYF